MRSFHLVILMAAIFVGLNAHAAPSCQGLFAKKIVQSIDNNAVAYAMSNTMVSLLVLERPLLNPTKLVAPIVLTPEKRLVVEANFIRNDQTPDNAASLKGNPIKDPFHSDLLLEFRMGDSADLKGVIRLVYEDFRQPNSRDVVGLDLLYKGRAEIGPNQVIDIVARVRVQSGLLGTRVTSVRVRSWDAKGKRLHHKVVLNPSEL